MIKLYIPKDKVLWAPFYCDGNMKKYFDDMGFNIIHQDKDFFSYTPDYEIIIDNPPFSTIKDVCVKLKELDKPFIIIARSNLIFCRWFQKIFKEHLQVIIPEKRPTFTHLTNPKKGYTPPFGTFFFCYRMNLPKDMIFL
jgi:Cft2 family RNA processing exonuclease